MTTPTDTPAAPAAWTAWRDRAMQLADDCERCAVDACIQGHIISPPELVAARAALAAHLDEVPMPRPIAHLRRTIDGSRWLDIPTPVLHGLPDVDVPLYRHPKSI